MDALALLAAGPMTGVVPTDGQSAPGAVPSAVAGDAFAAVFATALGGDAEATPLVPASAAGALVAPEAIPPILVAPAVSAPQSVPGTVKPSSDLAPSVVVPGPSVGKPTEGLPDATEPISPAVPVLPDSRAEALPETGVSESRTHLADAPTVAEWPVGPEDSKPTATKKGAEAPSPESVPLKAAAPEPMVGNEIVPSDEKAPAAWRDEALEKGSAPETDEAPAEPTLKPSIKTRGSRTAENAPKLAPKSKATARPVPVAQEAEANVPAPLNLSAASAPVATPIPTPVPLDTASNAKPTVDGPAVEPPIAVQGTNASATALPSAPDLRATPVVLESAPVSAVPQEGAKPLATPSPEALVAAVPNARIAQVAERASSGPSPRVEASEGVKVEAAKVEEGIGGLVVAPKPGEKAPEDGPKDERGGGEEPQIAIADAPTAVRTAATERPEAGENRPAVDRHLVVRQVADRIESLVASRPKDGVTIHLEPQDLGTVTLVVKGLSSALDVQVSASDDRVRQSLDASRPELAQALAPRGIELRELRVATPHAPNASSAPSTDSGAGGRAGAQQQQPPRSQTPNPSFARSARSEPAPARRAVRSSGRGVDLLV